MILSPKILSFQIHTAGRHFLDVQQWGVIKVEPLLEKGIGMLINREIEDTEYLRLPVVEKNKIWVAKTVEGITFMKPEDY